VHADHVAIVPGLHLRDASAEPQDLLPERVDDLLDVDVRRAEPALDDRLAADESEITTPEHMVLVPGNRS